MNKIEWLGKNGETWNPMVGCDGCEVGEKCWALQFARRHAHNPRMGENREKYARVVEASHVYRPQGKSGWRGRGIRWTGDIEYFPKRLEQPLHWKKPKRIAAGLMGDPFAAGVDLEYFDEIMAIISLCPQHTFILLTKRPERMLEYFSQYPAEFKGYPNLITGTSFGDQRRADERMKWLLRIPGRHCLSIEPMTEAVDARRYLQPALYEPSDTWWNGKGRIEEVYLGGGDAPLHPDWVRRVRGDCKAAGVKFVFKSWGKWVSEADVNEDIFAGTDPAGWECCYVHPDGRVLEEVSYYELYREGWEEMINVGKARSGRTLDGREHRGER